jgi:ABC-type uncharacterized transport system auxiliary subunit
MNMRPWLAWGVLVWSLNVVACSVAKPRPEVHHYALTLSLPEVASTGKVSLAVRSISARAPYDQERIVYRSSAYAFDFYAYHRWASPPGEQVSAWTRRYLRGSGLFSQVFPNADAAADFVLDGIVQQFEEIDRENIWEAATSVDFWLVRAGERTPVWFRSYSATRQATKRNPEAIAEAMSRNLENILGRLVTDLAPVVTSSTP